MDFYHGHTRVESVAGKSRYFILILYMYEIVSIMGKQEVYRNH